MNKRSIVRKVLFCAYLERLAQGQLLCGSRENRQFADVARVVLSDDSGIRVRRELLESIQRRQCFSAAGGYSASERTSRPMSACTAERTGLFSYMIAYISRQIGISTCKRRATSWTARAAGTPSTT